MGARAGTPSSTGRLWALAHPPSPLAGRAGPRDLASLFGSWTLSGPNACRRRPAPTPAFGRRPACVPEPIGKMCFSGEPADPGRQSRLTVAATVRPLAAAGNRLKLEAFCKLLSASLAAELWVLPKSRCQSVRRGRMATPSCTGYVL
jgi:hypothetical protein